MKSNWLLQGDIGTGKTRSLITLLPTYIDERGEQCEGAGQEVYLISLEPGAEATLGRNLCGAPRAGDSVIHQHFIPATDVPWDTLGAYITLANSLPMKTLIETADPRKREYRQAVELYNTCTEFVCDHCSQSFGNVAEWGDDRTAVIDSMTGLTTAFTQNLVGGKPIKTLPEYGVIMGFIESFLVKWWSGTQCSAGLLAHIDREFDPLTGMSVITMHTIGQKLAPRLVKIPDEVISSHYHDGRFYWSTEPVSTEVMKRRRLPLSDNLPADFTQIYR
jgi:hypothetical protein